MYILLTIGGQNDKIILKLSNYLRYFSKKKLICSKIWGGLSPLWSSSDAATMRVGTTLKAMAHPWLQVGDPSDDYYKFVSLIYFSLLYSFIFLH